MGTDEITWHVFAATDDLFAPCFVMRPCESKAGIRIHLNDVEAIITWNVIEEMYEARKRALLAMADGNIAEW